MNSRFKILYLIISILLISNLHSADDNNPSLFKLENKFWTLEFDIEHGGQAFTAVYKPADWDMLGFRPGVEAKLTGTFDDRLWSFEHGIEAFGDVSRAGRFIRKRAYQLIDHQAKAIEMKVTSSPGGAFENLNVFKKISIDDQHNLVRCDYKLTNNGTQAQNAGLWLAWFPMATGKKNFYHVTLPTGTDEVGVEGDWEFVQGSRYTTYPSVTMLGRARLERFVENPPRPWSAMRSEDGTGIAVVVDSTTLGAWQNLFLPHKWSIEAVFNEMRLAPDQSFETTCYLIPFTDFQSVDGASKAGVLGIRAGEEHDKSKMAGKNIPVQVDVATPRESSGKVILKYALIPENEFHKIGETSVQTNSIDTEHAHLTFTPEKPGTYLLTANYVVDGKIVICAEKTMVVEKSTGVAELHPPAERTGKMITGDVHYITQPQRMAVHFPAGYVPKMDVETAHIPWAKPLAGGGIKTLFIQWDLNGREIVELAQRIDLDFVTVLKETPGATIPFVRKALNEKLEQSLNLIILGGIPWDHLPVDVRRKILENVRQEGTGLVYTDPKKIYSGIMDQMTDAVAIDAPDLNIPLEYLPVFKENPAAVVKSYQFGKGKVILLNYFGHGRYREKALIPAAEEASSISEQLRDEYYYSALAKAALHAAQVNQSVRFDELKNISDMEFESADHVQIPINLVGNFENKNIRLLVKSRTSFDEINWQQQKKVADNPLKIDIKNLAAGRNYIDCQLFDENGKVLDWGTFVIDVNTPVAQAELNLNSDTFENGDGIRGTIQFDPIITDKYDFDVRIVDRFDRVIAAKQQRIERKTDQQASLEFTFENVHVVTKAVKVVAHLFLYNRTVATLEKIVVCKDDFSPAFRFTSHGSEYGLDFDSKNIRENGKYSEDVEDLLFAGQSYFCWLNAPDPFRIQHPEGTIRPGCLTNDEFIQKNIDFLKPYAEVGSKYHGFGFKISDEWGYGGEGNLENDFCHSPTCIHGFQEFLKAEYGTLAELNKWWGTEFQNWDAIVPPMLEDVKQGKYEVAWVDHRRYTEKVTADFFADLNGELQEIYPGMRVGLGGTPNAGSFNGYDWWRLSHTMPFVACYSGPQLEIIRSFQKPENYVCRWLGYDRAAIDEKGLRGNLWHLIFNRMDGALYYYMDRYSPLGYPDGTPNNKAIWLADEMARVKQGGLARLLNTAEPLHDGIAVHYSQSSIHLATRDGFRGDHAGLQTFNDNLAGVLAMLADLGLRYNFVSYEHVENGTLEEENYRVLILPFSQAISKDEAVAIERFVQNGGLLIADVRPAIADEHGFEFKHGLLDHVLGVKRSENCELLLNSGAIRIEQSHKIDLPPQITAQLGETGLTGVSAKALAKFDGSDNAAVWMNQFGQGKALLLNYLLTDYVKSKSVVDDLDDPDQVASARLGSTAIRDFYNGLLKNQGITPAVTISGQNDLPPCSVYRFGGNEAVEYVGILPVHSTPGEIQNPDLATVRFSDKGYVYDVRDKIEHGFTDEIQTGIAAGMPKLFAIMKYDVEGIEIEAPKQVEQGELLRFSARLNISGDSAPADHVLLIEMTGPDGKQVLSYKKDIVAKKGKLRHHIPVALNEAKGTWKLTVIDVITNQREVHPFSVK